MNASEINSKQIGGVHYGASNYAHWDFVIDNRLGYFEGQITKYVMRYKYKNGKEDLEKALHYLDKLIWAYELGFIPWPAPRKMQLERFTALKEYYELGVLEAWVCIRMTNYTSMAELEQVYTAIEGILKETV